MYGAFPPCQIFLTLFGEVAFPSCKIPLTPKKEDTGAL